MVPGRGGWFVSVNELKHLFWRDGYKAAEKCGKGNVKKYGCRNQ